MPELCHICQHAKIQIIEAALDAERAPNLVRAQFRLDPQMFAVHLAHRRALAQALTEPNTRNHLPIESWPSRIDTDTPAAQDTPQEVLKQALPYVRRAVQLAGQDRQAQEALVHMLNEVLQLVEAEDMGLP